MPNVSSASWRWFESPHAADTTLTYDARGKTLSAVNATGVTDHPHMLYGGLGQLAQSIDTAKQYFRDPEPWTTTQTFVNDALANRRLVQTATTNFPWPGATQNIQSGEQDAFAADSTGRLARRVYTANGLVDTLLYDAAGDVEVEYDPGPAVGLRSPHDRASYYGADGLLRAVDDRSANANGHLYFGNAFYTFEEYQYDALGRRVLTRSRRKCDMTNRTTHRLPCLVSFIRRTVWDGDMELDEVQMPAGDTSTTAPAVTDMIMEQDTGYAPLVKVDTLNGDISDPNPFFGRVAYTYGLQLDQPVAVNRFGYLENAFSGDSAHHFAAFSLSPLWNPTGVVDVAVFGDGGAVTCDPTGSTPRCTRKVLWLYGLTPYWRSMNDQLSWQGTLLEDEQDASGMLYRRSRYVDPTTGRFTQPDPIGLAGGANAYGFANGDPVSYQDPFGLCPGLNGIPSITDCPPGYFTILGAILGFFGGGAAGAGAGAVLALPTGELVAPITVTAGTIGGALQGVAEGTAAGSAVDAIIHMANADKARGGNAKPNRDVRRIANENNLNAAGRRALHDQITGQNLSLDEIKAIAEDLAKQSKYINNPPE